MHPLDSDAHHHRPCSAYGRRRAKRSGGQLVAPQSLDAVSFSDGIERRLRHRDVPKKKKKGPAPQRDKEKKRNPPVIIIYAAGCLCCAILAELCKAPKSFNP